MDSWWGVRILLPFLAFVLVVSAVGYLAYKGEQDFKRDCVAVSGQWAYDTDGDLECYVSGKEIAEHGESSPR